MLKRVLILSLALGLCEKAEPGSARTARGASRLRQPVSNRHPTSFQTTRRDRRIPPHRIRSIEDTQYIQNAGGKGVPAVQAAAEPRKHALSGMGVTLAAGLDAGYGIAPSSNGGTTRNAMAFSVMFERKLNDTLSLCPEISYSQRGVNTNLFNLGGVSVTGNVRLDYLEVPLLMKARLALVPRWKLFFVVGPVAGVALNREVAVLGLVQAGLNQRFNPFDFGLLAGGGVEYLIQPEMALSVHLRQHIGLVNLDNNGSYFYTRDIQLLLGVQFKL